MQVWHLATLTSLQDLCFSHPDYAPSPIARLCNYATYAAVNLPQLTSLDGLTLTASSAAVAEATYLKKKVQLLLRVWNFAPERFAGLLAWSP